MKIVRHWHRLFREAENPWRGVQGQIGWGLQLPCLLEGVTASVREAQTMFEFYV